MNLTLQLYNALVNRIPSIQRKYNRIRKECPGTAGRVYAWGALLGMNVKWALGFRRFAREECNPDCKKRIPKSGVESTRFPKLPPQELANQLLEADVISFDIFDTLILRPFSVPTDLFYLVGDKLNYMDFERLRRNAEKSARAKVKQQRGTYEVTLSEIWDELEQQTGISREVGMKTEIETELECCYGNPYMLKVWNYLQKYLKKQPEEQGKETIKETYLNVDKIPKKLICVSDMYLPCDVIKQMLNKCGFDGLDDVFVSCEYGASKGDGSLYKLVMDKYGDHKSYIHMGDNEASDVKQASKMGWQSVHYQDINSAGLKYRAEDMSVITGSFYRGIVNAGIYSGNEQYSKDYELGYIYGGLFVLGYCQFIHRYVKEHDVDKLLFLARDGDILYKAYQKLYPQDCGKDKAEYVYWSRTVATKMAAGYFKEDYFRRFLHHKVNQNYTMAQILADMKLEDMLDTMCREIDGFTTKTVLTQRNEDKVRKFLQKHWEAVLAHYEAELEAGKLYYSNVLEGCKKAVTVDIGWAGSGSITLDYIVNQIWKMDCEITGLIAGTNTMNNSEVNMSENALYSGKLTSYLYSQEQNRDIWKWHNPGKKHNLMLEMLLSSTEGSLQQFALDTKEVKGYRLLFKKPDMPKETVCEIQNGILTFIEDYLQNVPKNYVNHPISGSDAYGELRILLQSPMKIFIDMGI